MICPKCKNLGLKSKVYLNYSSSTLLGSSAGYWDEDGNWVDPIDSNTYETYYSCSSGHRFKTETHFGETETIIIGDNAAQMRTITVKWD